jgi:bacteriochlorophyll 4-vinyl reductase
MSEPRIGRFLVASLHQAIAELLPDRLEFYENWLSVAGLREGTIGLAPLHAVLSFLRGEGDVYHEVVSRAGDYAAQWTVNGLPGLERRLLRTLPLGLRTRAAMRTARGLVHATYPGSRAIVRMRKENVSIDVRGSLFCEVREAAEHPLCGFYAAAISRVLQLFAVPGEATLETCRAARGGQGCLMSVVVRRARTEEPAAA